MNNVAKIIAEQIGNRSLCMLGAKNLVASETALQFKIGRNGKGVTHVTVTLEPSDTYTLRFSRVRGATVRTVAEVSDVHVGELHHTIEKNTGLYTRL